MQSVTLAFEGINGAGKSRVIEDLEADLRLLPQNSVLVAKIGGFGAGQQTNRLRAILATREDKLRRNTLSEKELRDYQRDRIFRIAYRHQVHRFLATNTSMLTYVLLDRTPLMSWSYTAAAFPNSPFIEEVRKEAIEFSRKLKIRRVYLFEVHPETVYGRIMARNAKADPLGRTVDYFSRNIQAPQHVVSSACAIALTLLRDPKCTYKPFSIWDYMAYEDVMRQLVTYNSVVNEAARLLGFACQIIDGEKDVKTILSQIQSTLRQET